MWANRQRLLCIARSNAAQQSGLRRPGAIAPSVPHALHMPSHIYSRVGLWSEMVEGNRASYTAAKDELKDTTLGIGAYDALHAMDYMVFGQLQQAQDKASKQPVEEAGAIEKVNVENFVAAYVCAAMPARYALERGDWAQAAGNHQAALEYYSKLEELAVARDSERPELTQARVFLATRRDGTQRPIRGKQDLIV